MSRSRTLCLLMSALVFAFALAGGASAQLEGGLRLGVGAASLLNDDNDSDPRLGLQAGAFVRREFTRLLALRLEAVYAQKGAKIGDITTALDYFEIPLLAELSVPGTGLVPVFFSGPALAIRVSAERRGASGNTLDYGDLVEKYETNWVFGLGGASSISGRRVLFDLRYSLGLTTVFDFGDPADSDSDDKNQVLSANVSVALF